MKLFDQARAITRLVLFKSEHDTISEQARRVAEAARVERERTNREMDELVSSLIRKRVEKQRERPPSQGTNGPIHR